MQPFNLKSNPYPLSIHYLSTTLPVHYLSSSSVVRTNLSTRQARVAEALNQLARGTLCV